MADVTLSRRHQALRHGRPRSRPVALRSPMASSSCCSGRPARARPRRCALSPGLERPDAGQRADRRTRRHGRIAPAERDVAFVFQQYSLYPHLTVFDNLAFPLRSPARRIADERYRRAALERSRSCCASQHKLGNRATQLSGGEMQRVAIGRALVRRPAIYLMDEPLPRSTPSSARELRLELKRIQRDLGATMLYVTHDQIEAMTMADRIGVMNEGRLVQLGTPREIYERAGQHLCGDAARPARDQSHSRRTAAGERRAAGCTTVGLAHRAYQRSPRRSVAGPIGPGALGRASRRPEPSSSRHRRASYRDARGPAQRTQAGRSGFAGSCRAAVFRCGRQPARQPDGLRRHA